MRKPTASPVAQAAELLQKVVGCLPSELKLHVKELRRQSARNYSITVPIAPKHLHEIANTWKEEFKEQPAHLPEGRKLFLTIQRKPEVEKQYGAMAELREFTDADCDGTWAAKAFWSPDFEVHLEIPPASEGAESKAQFIAKGGVVSWDPKGLSTLGFQNTEEANQKLLRYCRKKGCLGGLGRTEAAVIVVSTNHIRGPSVDLRLGVSTITISQ